MEEPFRFTAYRCAGRCTTAPWPAEGPSRADRDWRSACIAGSRTPAVSLFSAVRCFASLFPMAATTTVGGRPGLQDDRGVRAAAVGDRRLAVLVQQVPD